MHLGGFPTSQPGIPANGLPSVDISDELDFAQSYSTFSIYESEPIRQSINSIYRFNKKDYLLLLTGINRVSSIGNFEISIVPWFIYLID